MSHPRSPIVDSFMAVLSATTLGLRRARKLQIIKLLRAPAGLSPEVQAALRQELEQIKTEIVAHYRRLAELKAESYI